MLYRTSGHHKIEINDKDDAAYLFHDRYVILWICFDVVHKFNVVNKQDNHLNHRDKAMHFIIRATPLNVWI